MGRPPEAVVLRFNFILNMRFLAVLLLLSATQLVRAQEIISDSVLIDDHYRVFHFVKPAGTATRSNLLFVLHGSGGTGLMYMKKNTHQLEAQAPALDLLVVYPDGYKRYWNECRRYATSAANLENINEEKFFRAMIQYFHKKYGINTNQVYAAGFSGGGHMAYKLGMQMSRNFRGIAAIVANLPTTPSLDCTPDNRALPVLIVNGTKDLTNPYQGGEMFVDNQSYGVVRSTDSSLAYWASLAGYAGKPVHKKLVDTDTTNQQWLETFTYDQPGKPVVQLLRMNGAGHEHPADTDVYTYVWNFFLQQQNRLLVTGTLNKKQPVQLAEVGCGICQFDMRGDDCKLAIRIKGQAYYVEGTGIDDHGDAHAKDGFCMQIRQAEVQGKITDGKYRITYFKLLPVR